MKGVILCAGRGTRMQPFSFTVPKTLLPVANQPILYHCITKMMQAGIYEMGIVINPQQNAIIDYLSRFQDQLVIQYFYQTEPLGIADALTKAQTFVGNHPFVLMLGDNLILESIDTLKQAYKGNKGALLLSEVENPSDYGVVEIENQRVIHIEEKPKHPKSNRAALGMYLFDATVFEAIHHLVPSPRGEYEITDVIQWMIDQGYPIAYSMTKKWYADVGTIERWLTTNQWLLTEQLGNKVQIGDYTKLENCILKGPVLIGNHCTLKNAVIGPYVSIQDHSTLIDCTVEKSICLQNTKIENIDLTISKSILGQRSHLQGIAEETGKWNLIVGDDSHISLSS